MTPRPVASRPDALPTLLRRLPETERTALLEQVLDGLRGKVRVRLLMAAPPSEEPSGEPGQAPPRRRPPERVVNTGFAPEARPDGPRDPHLPLLSDSACYFWLEVGPPVEGSIEATPTALPTDQLPPEARLTVALFGFPGEIEVIPGGDVGTLRLRPDGSTVVERQPAEHQGIDPDLLARRLFFPVRVPDREGVFRLRVHICYEQVLIQSRLVSARVMRRPVPQDHALQSVLDYTLARALSPAHLAQMMPHRLSLMLNANEDGTHGLRLLGADGGELFKKRRGH